MSEPESTVAADESEAAPEAGVEHAGGAAAVASPQPSAPSDAAGEARALAGAGDHKAAAKAYNAALASAPDDVGSLLGLAESLLALGRYSAAEREIRRALRLAPSRPEIHLQLGVVLQKRGVHRSAVAALRRALELDSACHAASLLLGESLNQLDEPDGAIGVLEALVRAQPSGRAYYALGIAYDRKAEPEQAARMYRRSRELGGR